MENLADFIRLYGVSSAAKLISDSIEEATKHHQGQSNMNKIVHSDITASLSAITETL